MQYGVDCNVSFNLEFSKKTDENYELFKPEPSEQESDELKSDGFVQPFNDSPLDEEDVSESVYLNLINQAEIMFI